jgi:hypothetical protein
VPNFRSIKEHGKISAAALMPASWHTAISVSRFISTESPPNAGGRNRTDPSARLLPTRNATRHTRLGTFVGLLRFHFVTFLRELTRNTNRSRLPGNFFPGCRLSGASHLLQSEAQRPAPPVPQAGRRFCYPLTKMPRRIGNRPHHLLGRLVLALALI